MKTKHNQIIKNAGYSLLRVNTQSYKGLFGGNCNHVVVLQNNKCETLCYNGKPYIPAVRASAFSMIIENGDIKANCFQFLNISFQK